MFSGLAIGGLPISPVVSQVLVQVLALQIVRHSNPAINHGVVQAGNLRVNPLLILPYSHLLTHLANPLGNSYD